MSSAPPQSRSPRRVYIKSYGCQMNVYDSGRMGELLGPLGYVAADGPSDADLVILNTCHIREKAAEKVYSELGRLKVMKDDKAAGGGRMILAVAGCVAQAEGGEVLRRAPHVDMVFGPQTYHRLPEMVARLHRKAGVILDTDFPAESKFDHMAAETPAESRVEGRAAFLTIQEGCDKFCAFCVVPYTRGAEFSRPVEQVVREAEALARAGAAEITLLGQNVNNYHGMTADGTELGLGDLARRLAAIGGLERIRYTTSYPADVDDALISAHAEVPELMPYLHLPVQSGSDRILRAMNRRHDRAFYMDLVAKLRAARPDLALSSDFIVGFPGETERDFEDTMNLVETVGFAGAYSFKYSPRPGTPAAAHGLQVPEDVKDGRLRALQELLTSQQRAFNQSCVGREMPVLLDRPGRHPGQLAGRTPYMQAAHVTAPEAWLGQIRPLEITAVTANSLAAKALSTHNQAAVQDAAWAAGGD